MKKIKDITVTYEDGTQEVWTGTGTVVEHTTLVKGDRPRDDKPVKYVNAVLDLQVSES